MADIKTLGCGCEVIVATNGSVTLSYCPLHRSAPKLYEALESAIKYLEAVTQVEEGNSQLFNDAISKGDKALADAKGGK